LDRVCVFCIVERLSDQKSEGRQFRVSPPCHRVDGKDGKKPGSGEKRFPDGEGKRIGRPPGRSKRVKVFIEFQIFPFGNIL
jgi:hypothetical protein